MKLPLAPDEWNRFEDQTMRAIIERADAENHKKNRDIEVGPARLIVKSADGTRWNLHVDNNGQVRTELA